MKDQAKYYHSYYISVFCIFVLIFCTAFKLSEPEEEPLNKEVIEMIESGKNLISTDVGLAKQYIFEAIAAAKKHEKRKLLRVAYLAASECYLVEEKFDSVVYYRELFVEEHYQLYLEEREKLLEYYSQLYSDSVDYYKKELLFADAEIKRTREHISQIVIFGMAVAGIFVFVIITYLIIQRNKNKKLNTRLLDFNKMISQQREEIMLQYEQLNMLNEETSTQNSFIEDHKKAITKRNDQLVNIFETNDKHNKVLIQNLFFAKQIQDSLLPSSAILKKSFKDFFILHKPRELVGGDFYWFYQSSRYVFVILADCTGHGVPGSFISVLGKTLLDKIIIEEKCHDPAKILLRLHNETINALATGKREDPYGVLPDDGMDIAICRFTKKTDKLTFAGARRPVCIFVDNELKEIRGDKFSIGSYSRQSRLKRKINFTNYDMEIKNNCLFYLFSDGYPSQMNKSSGKIGAMPFKQLIADNISKPLKEQKSILEDYFFKHKGNHDQTDDVSVIGLKVVGNV